MGNSVYTHRARFAVFARGLRACSFGVCVFFIPAIYTSRCARHWRIFADFTVDTCFGGPIASLVLSRTARNAWRRVCTTASIQASRARAEETTTGEFISLFLSLKNSHGETTHVDHLGPPDPVEEENKLGGIPIEIGWR